VCGAQPVVSAICGPFTHSARRSIATTAACLVPLRGLRDAVVPTCMAPGGLCERRPEAGQATPNAAQAASLAGLRGRYLSSHIVSIRTTS
jgi:hypothetical protein